MPACVPRVEWCDNAFFYAPNFIKHQVMAIFSHELMVAMGYTLVEPPERFTAKFYGLYVFRVEGVSISDQVNATLQGDLGSGLIDQSQKMTVAAMAMAEKKVWAQRS